MSGRIGHRTGESVMLGNLGLAALLERRPGEALEPVPQRPAHRPRARLHRGPDLWPGRHRGGAVGDRRRAGRGDAARSRAGGRPRHGRRARATRGRRRGTGDRDAEGGARRRAARAGARERRGAQPRRGGRARAPGHAGLSAGLSGSQPRSGSVAAMFPHTLVAAYAIRFRPPHPRTTRRPRPS